MRTLVGSSLLGVSLIGSLIGGPALAQQHPWVAGCVYAGGCGFTGVPLDAPAGAYGHVTGDHVTRDHVTGDPVTSRHYTNGDGWRAGRPATDELYEACHTGHSVFSCPGS